MKSKFIEGLEHISKNHLLPAKSFTEYTIHSLDPSHKNSNTKYIFLHGLMRCDNDVRKFMYDVAKDTKIYPINVHNFRAGEKSAKIKMIDQLAMLFHGLVKFYGGESNMRELKAPMTVDEKSYTVGKKMSYDKGGSLNMYKKSIVISGHSQGSALAVGLGQILTYLFDMRVFCPIYCGITEGTNAAKMYSKYPGALGLVPSSDFMNFVDDGFKILGKRGNVNLSILPFAVRMPSKLQKKLSVFQYASKYLSHFGEENDSMLTYKSQYCPNTPKKFICKKVVSIEACHEKWQNLVPIVKYIAKFLFRNITPILEHPKAISETIKAVQGWREG